MSAKTTTSQPPGRRTPLSLNAGTKQITKSTNDNKNNSNNLKTENSKKDFQPDRKLSSDKRQSSTDSRKPSTETKKPEESKGTKNDDNKKSQNGVNGNGVKDRQNPNSAVGITKPKLEATSPRKEQQPKIVEKKPTTVEVVEKVEVPKDAKNEDNKKKDENKSKKDDGKKKDKKEAPPAIAEEEVQELVVEKKKVVEKPTTELKVVQVESEPATKPEQKKPELMDTVDLEKLPEQIAAESPPDKNIMKDPVPVVKEKEIVEPPQQEKKGEKPIVPAVAELEPDDVEMMEPLLFDVKQSPKISAASTPAKPPKASPKSEVKVPRPTLTHSPDRKSCPRTFSSISGRRSIRPIGDYTFNPNSNIRQSYRKINTELDFTSSSLNVTVGSEVPNNDSFSFFSRSRKRDRSSPCHQSTMEIQGDISPKSPKRPRIESSVSGFFNAMASPITMLRARLSRASVQSTPKKLIVVPIDEEDIVLNVSGISNKEEITATEDLTVNYESTVENIVCEEEEATAEEPTDCPIKPVVDVMADDDIKFKETLTTNTGMQAKKKCSIM